MTYTHHTKRATEAQLLPGLSEEAFQRCITDYCQLRGLLFFHDHDSKRNNPGFPDLVIVGRTHTIWRELKTDKGKLRPDQEKWITALQATGQDVSVWRPRDWTNTVLPQLRALAGDKQLTKGPEGS